MPETKTKVLIIESDRQNAEQAAIAIKQKYPDAVLTIVQDMAEASRVLAAADFDLILYNPMSLFLSLFSGESVRRNDGTIKSPEIVDYLSEYRSTTDTKVKLLSEIEGERTKARLEGTIARLEELRAEVKALVNENGKQKLEIFEIRNQLLALNDLKQLQGQTNARIDALFDLEKDRDREAKIAIARMDADSKKHAAIVAAIAAAIAAFLTFLGTPTVKEFIERILPRHQETTPPQPTKTGKPERGSKAQL